MDINIPTSLPTCKRIILTLTLLTSVLSFGQNREQALRIQEETNVSDIQSFTSELKKDFTTSRSKVLSMAKANGWKISETLKDGNFVELQEVGPDGAPIYYSTFSDNVSQVSRANALYSNGALQLDLSGEGMQVGVWDGGVALSSHQEFDTRANIGDAANSVSAHATMVLGTLIASGVKEKAKGVAFKANATTNDWSRDKIEVAEAAANGLLLSNHSYGIKSDRVPEWYFGSYIKVSQDWDKIMFNAPYYLMVSAAGNAQRMGDNAAPIFGKTSDGFDLMLGFAASKNGVTVAAADTRINSDGSLASATVTNYSNFGPMDDSRIKPDIAGGGNNIYAANSSSTTSYDTSSGTSMATPGITGSMLLLQQYYERLNATFMKAATLKGIVLHTADDVDAPGPDFKMGWGVMNAKKAAELITNKDYTSIISEETLNNGATFTMTVKADGTHPLIASISWTDPAAEYVNRGILNDITPALVNDLDIRILKDGKEYLPWKLSAAKATAAATKGDNTVDPYERVEIGNAAGEYTIVVTNKGILKGQLQNFSLVVSGIKTNNCAITVPTGTTIAEASKEQVNISWNAQTDALFEVQYKEQGAANWTTEYQYEAVKTFNGLTNGKIYEVRLRTFCSENVMSDYTSVMEFTFEGEATKMEEEAVYEVLSIEEPLKLAIYPNPAVEQISINGAVSENARFSIVNTMGLTVKTGEASQKKIDVANLSTGLYILTVQDLEGVKSTKFYKS
ncbi:S8 family serine peptidase [Sediminicola sp. 1XM1-17]|uniref:S8 family serine peptidase n=1 Tax=Sediminicola sp. 1XM1-17 TaxID=3127702 RepID=UPI0030784198